ARTPVEVVVRGGVRRVHPPAEAGGGGADLGWVRVVGGGELLDHVLAEVLPALVDAVVEHQLGEHRQVGGGGEQPGVPGEAGHRVERLLVVHLPAQRVVPDVDRGAVRLGAEGDIPVPGVAVQLGGGDL